MAIDAIIRASLQPLFKVMIGAFQIPLFPYFRSHPNHRKFREHISTILHYRASLNDPFPEPHITSYDCEMARQVRRAALQKPMGNLEREAMKIVASI